ncbi:MAG: N-acetylmuramoyl-L-alanine amidase [Mycobacteriaceae bacterium]
MRARTAAGVAVTGLLLLTGCRPAPLGPLRTSSTAPAAPASLTTPVPISTTAPPPTGRPLLGKVVVLDPGHNGASAASPEIINAQVPNGRGGTKPCNTTGTSTDAGYPEHALTWALAQHVRVLLAQQGATVILTRPDDAGVGPCVDQRAATGNTANADAVVSIHGDGGPVGGQGFHVAYSDPPLNPTQSGPSVRLADVMRDALVRAHFTPSTYVGVSGLNPREDLAGLNLSTRPAVLVECANMRNPSDAAAVSSDSGRGGYAQGIADGIGDFLATG